MAIHTLVPFTIVFSAVNWEIHSIVVKGGGNPGIFRVAQYAIGGKLCDQVVGVVGSIVVIGMTAKAGIGRVDVIAAVTLSAVGGNSGMRAIKLIIAVVNGEGCRHPVGCGAMAHVAVVGYAQRQVAGVHTLVVIGHVAAFAGIGRVVVVAHVASRTVVGYWYMRSCEWVYAVVIKGSRRPGALRVA